MRETGAQSTLNPRAVPRAIDQRDRVVTKHRRASLVLLAALAALARAKQDPIRLPRSECRHGVWACESWDDLALEDDDDATTCAPYNRAYKKPHRALKPAVWVSGIVMALMAFCIGANDVANSWATSVGSGAIGLARGTIIAGVMDWIGAVSLGSGVSSKVSKSVSEITDEDCWACGYCDSRMTVYGIGMVGALVGASGFLLLATFASMPVSTTHAIVGGIVGMTMAGTNASCVDWSYDGVGGIIVSWVTSPAIAGAIGAAAFLATEFGLLRSANPFHRTRVFIPVLYAAVTFVMVYMVMIKAQVTKDLDEHIQIVAAVAAMAIMLGVSAFVFYMYVTEDKVVEMRQREDDRIDALLVDKKGDNDVAREESRDEREIYKSGSVASRIAEAQDDQDIVDFRVKQDELRKKMMCGGTDLDEPKRNALYLFRYLLVFTAALESFAHGANDTANATAAFSATLGTYQNGLDSCDQPETPVWIMAVGGFFVLLGVWSLGWRVIRTVGSKIATVDFHTAWCIEFGSTATIQEQPVSTTHCQIGAVTAVALASLGCKHVQWSMLGKILVSWILTIPTSAVIAAIILWIFRPAVCASCPWS